MLCCYDIDRILDRTRELAGADHMLVRALEKEISRPRHDLRAYWGWIFGSSVSILSIWLIGGNIYAAAQEKSLEQAIAIYAQQHPKTAPNQSSLVLMKRDKENILISKLRSFDLIDIENLLLAKVIEQQQLPNTDISKDLEAIDKIQQSIQTQPSLVGQILSRIGERNIAGFVRHLDKVPTGWGNNLFGRERYQKI